MIVEAYVPRYALPDVLKLRTKLMKDNPFDFGEARVNEWGTTHIPTESGMALQRNGASSSATMIGAWTHLLSSKDGMKLSDIYSTPIQLDMPEGLNPRIQKENTEYEGKRYATIEVSIFAAYKLFGIPSDQWELWANIDGISSAPHFVYRYRVICRQFGIDPIDSTRYSEFYAALRDYKKLPQETYYGPSETGNKVSLEWITNFAKIAKAISDSGVDPSTIDDLGHWVADEWNWEAIINLNRAGVKQIEAMQLWDSGLQDSTLIQQHLVDGIPLDWVMDIYTLRKGNK